jgi:tetratricopeptide (TPR) repeat protein
MKQALYLFLLFTQVFFAQNGFEKGNDLYQKAQFKEAAEAYENVLRYKKHSAELYFNLGNCYYKLNKVHNPIYNYSNIVEG